MKTECLGDLYRAFWWKRFLVFPDGELRFMCNDYIWKQFDVIILRRENWSLEISLRGYQVSLVQKFFLEQRFYPWSSEVIFVHPITISSHFKLARSFVIASSTLMLDPLNQTGGSFIWSKIRLEPLLPLSNIMHKCLIRIAELIIAANTIVHIESPG